MRIIPRLRAVKRRISIVDFSRELHRMCSLVPPLPLLLPPNSSVLGISRRSSVRDFVQLFRIAISLLQTSAESPFECRCLIPPSRTKGA
jgi:hypothetical protein